MIFSDYCYCLCPSSWRLQAGCAADGWKRGGNCANISTSGLQRSLPVFSRADRPKGSPPEHMIIFINRTVMCHLIKKKHCHLYIHVFYLINSLIDSGRVISNFPVLQAFICKLAPLSFYSAQFAPKALFLPHNSFLPLIFSTLTEAGLSRWHAPYASSVCKGSDNA